MFKSIRIIKIADGWVAPALASIENALASFAFVPLSSSSGTLKDSTGWVPPRGEANGPYLESIAGDWILKFEVERKSVPASVIKKELKARIEKLETHIGRKVGKSEKKELKEAVELELLPRAFSKQSSVFVWIDVKNHNLIIGSTSKKLVDDVLSKLVETFQSAGDIIPTELLNTNVSPAAAMTSWLLAKEGPGNFALERDLELRTSDSEKSTVRYTHHNLELDEIANHISEGKAPTQVALTWNNRVSFVLDHTGALKKISFLEDVFLDQDEEGFDADVAIACGELKQLIPELLVTLS